MKADPYDPYPFDDYYDSLIKKTIQQQQAKVDAYQELIRRKLPVPHDLRQEIEGSDAQG